MEKTDESWKMELKLFVDNKSSKVLFAEADKEFVDFLFSILALPLGVVTRLLKQKHDVLGSLGSLYTSIESLDYSYIQPNLSKEAVLCPKVTLPMAKNYVPLLKCEGVACCDKLWYRCCGCRSVNLSDNPLANCSTCGHVMNIKVTFLNPSSGPAEIGGYVRGLVKYMVMDDLAVIPMSTVSIISMLNSFNIKDVGVLEEKIVNLGMDSGLKLLRAYLHSKTVLTDVFLSKTEA
ncbi:unnamed protein product [Rhodiola kirilowii]